MGTHSSQLPHVSGAQAPPAHVKPTLGQRTTGSTGTFVPTSGPPRLLVPALQELSRWAWPRKGKPNVTRNGGQGTGHLNCHLALTEYQQTQFSAILKIGALTTKHPRTRLVAFITPSSQSIDGLKVSVALKGWAVISTLALGRRPERRTPERSEMLHLTKSH